MVAHKLNTAAEYDPELTRLVQSTCLYIATILNDLVDDVTIIGGLVPYLMIEQKNAKEKHAGTMDLDIGLSMALVKEQRYLEISDRLSRAGFSPDKNENGNETFQRWVTCETEKITVDFMINPLKDNQPGGTLQNLEKNFAAFVAPGLKLAFEDREKIELKGYTIKGEKAAREIYISGVGAYVLLKSLAFRGRGENKDAYDLFYTIKYYEGGIENIAERINALKSFEITKKAINILKKDFREIDNAGPVRVAEFYTGSKNDEIQGEVAAFISKLCAFI